MADVEEVKVVVAHNERATLRVGDVFVKIDADQTRTDVEVEAMAMAPIPTPEVLWRKPPVLALAALPGTALGRLGEPSTSSPAAWAAAGAAARMLHDAPLPPWPGRSVDEIASELDGECEWLVTNDVLPADLVTRNRQVAEAALRPWTPVFTHGDLQVTHVFVDGDEITGVIDWSEASQGDALFDLAILTLGHEEHLDDVIAGYGTDVDLDRDPRVVVPAKPAGGPLADRARLRPIHARLRVRRAEIPAVRLRDPTATNAVLPHRPGHLLKRVVFRTDEVMALEAPGQPVGDIGTRRTTRVEDAPQPRAINTARQAHLYDKLFHMPRHTCSLTGSPPGRSNQARPALSVNCSHLISHVTPAILIASFGFRGFQLASLGQSLLGRTALGTNSGVTSSGVPFTPSSTPGAVLYSHVTCTWYLTFLTWTGNTLLLRMTIPWVIAP